MVLSVFSKDNSENKGESIKISVKTNNLTTTRNYSAEKMVKKLLSNIKK